MNRARVNGRGICSLSQLFTLQYFAHSTLKGRIGLPVFLASASGPGFTSYRGPRGPSTVNAIGNPRRMYLIASTSAFTPPRLDDPRIVPNPNRFRKRAMYSPSRLWDVTTTTPRSRRKYVPANIRSCQRASIGTLPLDSMPSRCSVPDVSQRIVRQIMEIAQ